MSMQGREVSQTVYGRVIWRCGVISLLFFFSLFFCARFAASRRWHRREVCLDLELFSTQVKIGSSVPVVSVECRGDGCFRPAKSTRARAVCA